MPCHVSGCRGRPRYGASSDRKYVACSAHKDPTMICLDRAECENVACSKTPCFGPAGGKAVRCLSHKHEHDINVKIRRCAEAGCSIWPSYGYKRNVGVMCAQHRKADMVTVQDNRIICTTKGCGTRASHGYAKKKPQKCAKHKSLDMVPLHQRLCLDDKCNVVASYGDSVTGPLYCNTHKKRGMQNMKKATCKSTNCELQRIWGFPNRPAEYCKRHAQNGMTNRRGKCCQHLRCQSQAHFGTKEDPYQMCAKHRSSLMKNFNLNLCAEPGCETCVSKSSPYAFCAQHDRDNKRVTRIREHQVANYLREAEMPWTSWNKQLQDGPPCDCKARPDFVFDVGTHIICLEIDELQHAYCGYVCEEKRMVDIFNSFGGLHVSFVRFNPDAYEVGQEKKNPDMKWRLPVLLKELQSQMASQPKEPFTIVRMFYDHPNAEIAHTVVSLERGEFCEKREHSPAYGLSNLSGTFQEDHGLRVDTVDCVHGADVQVS